MSELLIGKTYSGDYFIIRREGPVCNDLFEGTVIKSSNPLKIGYKSYRWHWPSLKVVVVALKINIW